MIYIGETKFKMEKKDPATQKRCGVWENEKHCMQTKLT